MEFLKDSSNTFGDCEFKFLPKFELEKIVTKVRTEAKSGMWNNFCTISSALDNDNDDDDYESNYREPKHVRVMTDDEVHSILQPKNIAPLFGPPRRFHARLQDMKETETMKIQALSCKSSEALENPQVSSAQRRVVEEVNVADIQQLKQSPRTDDVQEQQQQTIDDESEYDDDDDNDTILNERVEFLRELEDFIRKEKEEKEKHSNETVAELICDVSDKKFDFRNDEEKQPQNDAPQTLNQLSSNVKQQHEQRVEKSSVKKHERLPKGPEKVQNSVKATSDANEKSQSTTKPSSSASAHFYLLMSKVVGYQEKICHYLDCLYEIICNPPQMIDVNDLSRRQQRSSEFANRFSRNHLYQIGRTTEELRIMPNNPVDISSKVEVLFLYIMQATQSYLKSVEMFIYTSCPDKLSALIDAIIAVLRTCVQKNVYSSKDKLFTDILNKCDEMNRFIALNRNARPTFLAYMKHYLPKKDPKKIRRSSKDFVSPYVTPFSFKDHKSPYAPPKNPFPIPKMVTRSKIAQNQGMPPKIRKTNSEISTMVGREEMEMKKEEKLMIKSDEGCVPKEEVDQLMSMINNVTKEKVSEIFGSLYNQLSDKVIASSSSDDDQKKSTANQPPSVSNSQKSQSKKPKKIEDEAKKKRKAEKLRKMHEEVMADRLRIMQARAENPINVPDVDDEPWKLICEVSDKMLENMLDNVLKDFDFGESKFIESFLKHELSC